MNKVHPILSFVFLLAIHLQAQVNYTAKDVVTPYDGHFRPACNLGSYTSFSSQNLADLAAGNSELGVRGVGVKALRPGMFDEFTTIKGYDDQLPVYDHHKYGEYARNADRVKNVVYVPHPCMTDHALVGSCNQEGKGPDQRHNGQLQP